MGKDVRVCIRERRKKGTAALPAKKGVIFFFFSLYDVVAGAGCESNQRKTAEGNSTLQFLSFFPCRNNVSSVALVQKEGKVKDITEYNKIEK